MSRSVRGTTSVLLGVALAACTVEQNGSVTAPARTSAGAATSVPEPTGLTVDQLLEPWSLDGTPSSLEESGMHRGTEHCDWEAATFLVVGWPPGHQARGGNLRQYVRDPEGVLRSDHATQLVLDAELPADAAPTGFHDAAGIELWVAADGSTAYLVGDEGSVEAWPRAEPVIGCD
jgi:hypothetical protein